MNFRGRPRFFTARPTRASGAASQRTPMSAARVFAEYSTSVELRNYKFNPQEKPSKNFETGRPREMIPKISLTSTDDWLVPASFKDGIPW